VFITNSSIDGRIKPDIVAPGQYVYSAKSDGNLKSNQCGGCKLSYIWILAIYLFVLVNSVFPLAGTSMATPVVSGSAALIRQYFLDGRYPTSEKVKTIF
jgi:subtilisin family serine protease